MDVAALPPEMLTVKQFIDSHFTSEGWEAGGNFTGSGAGVGHIIGGGRGVITIRNFVRSKFRMWGHGYILNDL